MHIVQSVADLDQLVEQPEQQQRQPRAEELRAARPKVVCGERDCGEGRAAEAADQALPAHRRADQGDGEEVEGGWAERHVATHAPRAALPRQSPLQLRTR